MCNILTMDMGRMGTGLTATWLSRLKTALIVWYYYIPNLTTSLKSVTPVVIIWNGQMVSLQLVELSIRVEGETAHDAKYCIDK